MYIYYIDFVLHKLKQIKKVKEKKKEDLSVASNLVTTNRTVYLTSASKYCISQPYPH